MSMQKDSKGRFKKGGKPWNKGMKGIHLSPDTEFREGDTAGEKSSSWKGGVQEMSNDCVHIYDGVGKRKRRPRDVYEKEKGPIPEGYVIYHLDGDKHNDDIDNLIAVSRAELLKLNKKK